MLAKHLSDIRKLRGVFVQRGNFVVSFVAELPANRGTYVHSLLLRHFASVVWWLRACVLAVMFSRPQLGGAIVRCQHEHRKKASFVLPARVIWSVRVEGSQKRIRASCDREEGQRAQHTRRTHTMGLVARSEPQTLPSRGSEGFVRLRCKKRGPNRDRIDDQVQ